MKPEESDQAMEKFLAGRDCRFVCFCCGENMVEAGTREDGRKLFECDNEECRNGKDDCKFVECIICHKPTSMFADKGNICMTCGGRIRSGEIQVSPDEARDLAEWEVKIPIGPPGSSYGTIDPSLRN